MTLYLIILIIGIVSIIIGCVFAHKANKTILVTVFDYITPYFVIGGILVTLIATILFGISLTSHRELANFLKQKEYIENYESTSEYDTAAIANKKIELNEWLYSAQYTKEHYPLFSFHSDEILEIEPIK